MMSYRRVGTFAFFTACCGGQHSIAVAPLLSVLIVVVAHAIIDCFFLFVLLSSCSSSHDILCATYIIAIIDDAKEK